MTDKKATTHRKIPAISEAPPPENPIRVGGYRPPSNTPARYKYWNLVPAVTIDQFILLIFGCDPGTELIMKTRQTRADLLLLIHAHEAVDTFPKPIDPWAANPLYRAVELKEWAEPLGYRAEDWKPIKQKSTDDIKSAKPSVDVLRYRDALAACGDMRSSQEISTPKSLLKDVIPYIFDQYGSFSKYSNCGSANLQPIDLESSIRRGGRKLGIRAGNPLYDPQYLAIPDIPVRLS